MSIKIEECEGKRVKDPHWEIGALYQYELGSRSYYYCLKHEGVLYLVNLSDASYLLNNTQGLSKTNNRKLSKGECITLTVE